VLEEIDPLPPERYVASLQTVAPALNLPTRAAAPAVLPTGSGKTAFAVPGPGATACSPAKSPLRGADDFPDEWQVLSPRHIASHSPAYDGAALQLLYELACQAEAAETQRPALHLLLFDGLIGPAPGALRQENLRYLFEYGRSGIWPW